MKNQDPRVDEYIARSQAFAKPILKRIRAMVHDGCPEVQETMKWSFPHFVHHGVLCSMASFKAHCAFGFSKEELMNGDRSPSTTGSQFGRICQAAGDIGLIGSLQHHLGRATSG